MIVLYLLMIGNKLLGIFGSHRMLIQSAEEYRKLRPEQSDGLHQHTAEMNRLLDPPVSLQVTTKSL